MDVTNLNFLSTIVVSACILHNYVLQAEGLDDDDFSGSSDSSSEEEDDDDDEHERADARQIRDNIAARL